MVRLLVLMGSGETSPTMVKTHREVLGRVGAGARAVLLDTPVGFQENASQITQRAVEYFAESLVRHVDVASFRRAGVDALDEETAFARVREAAWVFCGPGSPTYALRQWSASPIPDLFRAKLRAGGVVVLSSAAVCTAGRRCVPVYEVYKVGLDPYWLDGMDLLAEMGLGATVIPHFDNTEGGNHDTRYCYLGERRLAMLETEMGDEEFVLGIDEHTGAVFDLDAGTMTVTGNGAVHVRQRGETQGWPAGTVVPLSAVAPGGGLGAGAATASKAAAPERGAPVTRASDRDPLAVEVGSADATFAAALAERDAPSALRAALELDAALTAWMRDTAQSADRASAIEDGQRLRRSMLVRLGEAAIAGLSDPRIAVAPFVDALLELRGRARAEKRFADSDLIRDRLTAAGVEVRDTPNRPEWLLVDR